MHFSRLDRRERVSRCYTLPSPRTQRIFAGPTGSIRTKKLLTHSQRITTLVSNSLTYPWARRTERERERGREKKKGVANSRDRATVLCRGHVPSAVQTQNCVNESRVEAVESCQVSMQWHRETNLFFHFSFTDYTYSFTNRSFLICMSLSFSFLM